MRHLAGSLLQLGNAIIDIIDCMASITIRNLDDDAKERLRVRAASNGRSMEAEARAMIEDAVSDPAANRNILDGLRELGRDFGPIELPDRNAETERIRDPFAAWTAGEREPVEDRP